jgi:hypothetical protein
MKTKMVGMFAVLMIALMAIGFAYGLWSKTLYINGTVNTGSVNAEFANVVCSDTGVDPGYDKDVASCNVVLSDDKQTMTVTISNAYPCYSCKITYNVVNTGTIPVKIQSITVTNPNSDKLTVTVTGIAKGDQIDAGESKAGDLEIHVEQAAAQGATYTFSVEIYLVQWNEYTP